MSRSDTVRPSGSQRPAGGAVAISHPRLATASAVVSIARGMVGLVIPRAFAVLAGTRPDATRTRLLFGAREVVIGVGLLGAARKRRWLEARLAGDVVDVMLHTREALDHRVRSRRTLAALVLVVIAAAVDAWLVVE